MDIDAFRQMVAKNPKGFLGRYGLGNKIIQEGGNLTDWSAAVLRMITRPTNSTGMRVPSLAISSTIS